MTLCRVRTVSVFTIAGLLGCGGRDPGVGAGSGDAGVGVRGSDGGVIGSKPGTDGGGGTDANNVNWPVIPNDASGPTVTNGVSLTISSTVRESAYDGLYAPAGTQFFVVGVSLGNTGTGATISANPIFFSLTTTQSLVISAYPLASPGACTASVSVASAGTFSCFVVFKIASGETPSAIVYNDVQGDKASAPVSATPSAATVCNAVWSPGGNTACTSCINSAESSACSSSIAAFNQACQFGNSTCSACPTPGDFCACEPACDSTACQSLFTAMTQCIFNQCSAQCP